MAPRAMVGLGLAVSGGEPWTEGWSSEGWEGARNGTTSDGTWKSCLKSGAALDRYGSQVRNNFKGERDGPTVRDEPPQAPDAMRSLHVMKPDSGRVAPAKHGFGEDDRPQRVHALCRDRAGGELEHHERAQDDCHSRSSRCESRAHVERGARRPMPL